jgi:hypothetical protein
LPSSSPPSLLSSTNPNSASIRSIQIPRIAPTLHRHDDTPRIWTSISAHCIINRLSSISDAMESVPMVIWVDISLVIPARLCNDDPNDFLDKERSYWNWPCSQ